MPPAAQDIFERQRELSSYMRVLAALNFESPSSKISDITGRSKEFGEDLHHLETIAACLVTGKKGDVVASAFSRKQDGRSLTIVLARNDAASREDEEDARIFLRMLKNKQQLDALFPFLVKRGKDRVQRCINKVRDLTWTLNKKIAFDSVIEAYCGKEGTWSLKSQFRGRGQQFLNLYNVKGTDISSAGLQQILKDIIKIFRQGLALDTRKETSVSFILFANAAAALSDSGFFGTLQDEHSSRNRSLPPEADKFPKFQRNLDKMRTYLRISELGDFIQSFPLVSITWVPKSIASPQHVKRMKNIVIPSVLDVALELAKQSAKNNQIIQRLGIEDLRKKFSKNPFWQDSFAQRTSVTPRLHAEVQIVLHMAGEDKTDRQFIPIGCSKRSCLQCEIVMKFLADGRWRTAGAHGWPYHTAALVGNGTV